MAERQGESNMRRIAYAVAKQSGLPYQFSTWHDTKELAIEEAERLCKKEGKTFIILCLAIKLVGFSEVSVKPSLP